MEICERRPNAEAEKFDRLVNEGKQPLYPGSSPKKPPLKPKFVTTHQLQQQQKKMNKKSPEVGKMMSGEQDVPVKEKPNARRKLELEDDTSDGENIGENDVAVKSAPLPPLTEYEKQKIHNLEENEKVYRKLGLFSLVSSFKHDVAQNSKWKGKNGKSKKGKDKEPDEECDSQYIPKNEGDDQSDDSLEKLLGPRTRSRANVAPGIEKEVRRADTVAEKEVTSSYRPTLVKPTCSKIFKQSSKDEGVVGAGTVAADVGTGTVADYLALRDRQKKNEAAPTKENVGELNLEEPVDVEVEEGNVYASLFG
ncbi:hypothetical protein POM88_031539 [Heracleum sosnowskyi]|uniref:Uncharacterized protein n=1 Tax=Heracleum sosnowskyi TaxID=360622 RepID=A0AAD8MJ83_9APIA|nr:hypothetical protein POM88_031539 [Heracleum sosnowskyi]